jgi:catalase
MKSNIASRFFDQEPKQLTTDYGRPMSDRAHVISVGAQGPLLLSDFPFIEDIQRFNRERIPERVVHGKG